MPRLAIVVGAAMLALVQGACSDNQSPTAPRLTVNGSTALADERGGDQNGRNAARIVDMDDACDGPSFTAQGIACARNGGQRFDQFIEELTKKGVAGAWRFSPPNLVLQPGQTFAAVNRGGEAHTFTRVAHFGGGLVPSLNQLSGNPTPAAECLASVPSGLIPPSAMSMPEVAGRDGALYQCCIHPWMRTLVTTKHG